tara:strand:+ start:44 stop:295 length:252 start_codon:yes stop_codon:yes gene_type:complete
MPQIAEPITSLEQELESRIEWLEKGLKEIANKTLGLDDMIQAILDGEPTTADEHNVVRISDVNKEITKEWNRDREERINKENK